MCRRGPLARSHYELVRSRPTRLFECAANAWLLYPAHQQFLLRDPCANLGRRSARVSCYLGQRARCQSIGPFRRCAALLLGLNLLLVLEALDIGAPHTVLARGTCPARRKRAVSYPAAHSPGCHAE